MSIEHFIDALDEVYEHCFWSGQSSASGFLLKQLDEFLESHISGDFDTTYTTSNVYHLFDNMLADLFKALERENWPKGVEATVTDLLKQWEEKYQDEKDVNNRSAKIKSEYLQWLRNNEWHVLHNGTGHFTYDDFEEKINDYNDRYNKHAVIHSSFLDNKSNSNESYNMKAVNRMEEELFQIKLALQHSADFLIIQQLIDDDDLTEFIETFPQPFTKFMSKPIFSFIDELLSNNSSENINSLLKTYAKSIYAYLENFENKYSCFWIGYFMEAITNDEDIDSCCLKIYQNEFAENQSKKCDYFVENRDDYRELSNSIMKSVGNMFAGIAKKDKVAGQIKDIKIGDNILIRGL